MPNNYFLEKAPLSMVIIVSLIFFLIASASAHDEAPNPKTSGDTPSVTYTGNIQPLFMERCVGCHGGDAPEHKEFKKDKEGYKARDLGPRMDTYTHLISFVAWPDTGAVMRRLDDGKISKKGKQGNMYPHLGDSEQERQTNLQLFKEWVGNWSVRRW